MATPLSASPALRSGATSGARVWRGLARTRCAQTIASLDPPNPALLGASRGAKGTKHPHGPLLRSAPTRGRKRHALRKLGRAQRWPVWLFGCWMFGSAPLLAAPAAGRLRGGMGVGAPMPRELTRRGCLNEAATQRSEFHGAPRNRHDAGLPRSEAQGSQTGGRLFFGDFLLAKQKKVTRMPGDSRLPHSTRACSSHRAKASTGPTRTDGMVPRLRQAQPERERENSGTIKTIATYAL